MKKHTIALIIIVLAVLAGCLAGALGLRQPTANNDNCRLYLPDCTNRDTLCDSLVADGVLHSTKAFRLVASLLRLDNVRPGSYVVEPHMRTLTLVRKLRNGQQDPIRLTIGKFRLPEQLNTFLNTKLMHNDFNVTLESFHLILPDTYEFYWTVTPHQFMHRMEKEYNAFWSTRTVLSLPSVEPFHETAHKDSSHTQRLKDSKTHRPSIRQLYADIAAPNTASLALFRKAGYTQCGHFKEWLEYDSHFVDTIRMQKIL